MRLTLWFILILAFSVGMCCAIAMKTYVFEAVPISEQSTEPTTKILVAKRTMPAGIEITADSVAFQEVAASEVPLGSLTSFDQVFRRQPAYPIPVGCPLCEDLLSPLVETETKTAFLPAGSQVVILDVARIRQGGKVLSSSEPLAAVLVPDQRIDIRVVPRDEVQGALADKKNEVLRTFAAEDYQSSGELLLENIPIYQVQKKAIGEQFVTPQVSLVLDKEESALLTAAAKKGQIRILLAEESDEKLLSEFDKELRPSTADSIVGVEMAVSSPQDTPVISVPAESIPVEVPLVSEFSSLDAVEPVPAETVASVLSETELSETVEKTAPNPKNLDIFETALPLDQPQAPVPELAYSALKEEKMVDTAEALSVDDALPKDSATPAVPEIVIKEKIRNDPPVIAFGTPAVKVISDQSGRQKPMQAATANEQPLTDNWRQETSMPSYAATVSESPQISHSLPFHTPNAVIIPAKEFPKEAKKWTESVVVPREAVPSTSISISPMPTVSPMPVSPIPIISPIPNIVQEKIPSYSPFERRTYTIQSDGELSEESYDVLPAPSLIQESTD